MESGYDKILQVLGSTPTAFLENLDALHDHLQSIYPGMRAPSFRCTRVDHRSIILHYYSEREGLEPIVLGLVKTVAARLHGVEVTIKVHSARNVEQGRDHTQFLIEETGKGKLAAEDEVAGKTGHSFRVLPRMSPSTFADLFPFHLVFDKDFIIRGS